MLVRVDPDETDTLVAKPHAQPFVMRGREMDGWLRVEAEGVRTKRQLERWVAAASDTRDRCPSNASDGAVETLPKSLTATPVRGFRSPTSASSRPISSGCSPRRASDSGSSPTSSACTRSGPSG